MYNEDIKVPSNKKFGLFFTFIFLIISAYYFWNSNFYPSFILSFFALAIFIVTIINSTLLLPLNKLWMKLGMTLASIFNPIILGILFFGMFFPIGGVTRLFGRDELNLKLCKDTSSWKQKKSNIENKQNFNQQF